jgi:tetratricopeptide (TPR) repeat protein
VTRYHRIMRRFLLLASALLFATTQAVAQPEEPEAPPPDPATELYDQGTELAQQGKWAEARDKLEQAVQLRASPIGLFNLAQAERNLGQLASAKRHFVAARAMAAREGSDDVARLADDSLAEINPRLPHVKLVLPRDAARIEVQVDGRPAEATAGDVEIDPGEHELVVTAAGEKPFVKRLLLRERQRMRLVVEFPKPEPPPAPVPVPSTPKPAPRSAHSGPPTGALVIAGAGVLALAGGTYFLLRRNSKLEQAAEGCIRTGDGWRCPTSLEHDPTHNDLRDDADQAGTFSTVLFGVGAAAVVGAGIWWALDRGSERPPSVGFAIEPHSASASFRAAF